MSDNQLPAPYASGENWTLYHGDCLAILPHLPKVDAVVTDPPYGINVLKKSNSGFFTGPNGKSAKFWGSIAGDDKPFDPTPLVGLAKIVCIWGANHFAHLLPPSARWLVWDKRDGRRSNPLADCEMAWTNDTRPARLFSHLWIGAVREDERGEHFHPTQKSVTVIKWSLEVLEVCNNSVVLDAYCGSGSIGVACIKTGRRFIGIEIDEKYCEIAAKRIQKAEQEAAEILTAGGVP